MTTIVQNPNGSSSAGWVALVIVLLGVIVVGALYYTGAFEGLVQNDNDVINIDLPDEVVPDTSGGSGEAAVE